MIDDDKQDKSPSTGSTVSEDGRATELKAGTFGMNDMHGDLRAGLRRKSKDARAANESREPAEDLLASAVLRDPLKAAYMIIGTSALFTAMGSTLLLHLIGGPQLGSATRWLAPLTGSGMFALLGMLLAWSSVVRPK